MSTPVGHSRLQPLHETQSAIVSRIASEASASGPSWPDKREAQRVGAAARQMLLVAGGAVGRAHHARIGSCGRRRCCCTSRRRWRSRPIPTSRARSSSGSLPVARLEAEERAVVHLRRADDLAGIEQARRDRTCPSPPRRRARCASRTSARGIPSARCRRRARRNASPCIRAPSRRPPRRSRASAWPRAPA